METLTIHVKHPSQSGLTLCDVPVAVQIPIEDRNHIATTPELFRAARSTLRETTLRNPKSRPIRACVTCASRRDKVESFIN